MSTTTTQQTAKIPQAELHKTFIAMIFAFAISFAAQQVAEFLIVLTNNWSIQRPSADVGSIATGLLAIGTHLFLSMLMISVSWVMWSRSQAPGHLTDVERIFSIKFGTFILEVLLVTIYYSLAKTAETDFRKYEEEGRRIAFYITNVSARPEAAQMAAIFAIFAIWDLIVDVVQSPLTPAASSRKQKIFSYFTGVAVYCFVSLVCAISSLIVFVLAPPNGNPIYASIGDVALIVVLLFFHQAKTIEYYLIKFFPAEGTRNNTKRLPTRRSNIGLAILTTIYLTSIILLAFPCIRESLA